MTTKWVEDGSYIPVSGWQADRNDRALGRWSGSCSYASKQIREIILNHSDAAHSVETGQYMLVNINDHTFRSRIFQTPNITYVYIHADDYEAFYRCLSAMEKAETGQLISPWRNDHRTDAKPSDIVTSPYTVAKKYIESEFILKHPGLEESIIEGTFMDIEIDSNRFRARVRGTPLQNNVLIHVEDRSAYRDCVHRVDLQMAADGVNTRPTRFERAAAESVQAAR